MDIRNVTEFRNFVNNNKLRGLSNDIDAVAVCIEEYERGCSCWKPGDQARIYNNCKALYVRAVGTISRQFAGNFVAYTLDGRVRFYLDGACVGSVGR